MQKRHANNFLQMFAELYYLVELISRGCAHTRTYLCIILQLDMTFLPPNKSLTRIFPSDVWPSRKSNSETTSARRYDDIRGVSENSVLSHCLPSLLNFKQLKLNPKFNAKKLLLNILM